MNQFISFEEHLWVVYFSKKRVKGQPTNKQTTNKQTKTAWLIQMEIKKGIYADFPKKKEKTN